MTETETDEITGQTAQSLKEVVERWKTRSLYRIIFPNDNPASEYAGLVEENKERGINHGGQGTYTRNISTECRWYPEYPSKADFGKEAHKPNPIVLQTVFDPSAFELYRSAEGPHRFSQKAFSQIPVIVHTERMSQKEKKGAKKHLLEIRKSERS